MANVSPLNFDRFDRQIRFLGKRAQKLISTTKVLMLGTGGGNSQVSIQLACMGIGELFLVDPDRWAETDRNRVFIPREFVGKRKVSTLKKLIEEYFPDVRVDGIVTKAEYVPDEIYREADIIVVGTDTISSRIYANRKAIIYRKPALFPYASIYSEKGKLRQFFGVLQVYIPGKTPCFECWKNFDKYRLLAESLDPKRREEFRQRYNLGDELNIPVEASVSALNYIIAGAAVWEILKIITSIDKPIPLQVYNGISRSGRLMERINLKKDPNCPACSLARRLKSNSSLPSREDLIKLGEKR